jgi:2-succinyl-5-enolpyruvyl-6-hydroxy-3-cyclohexene-1-carboxylate synthase
LQSIYNIPEILAQKGVFHAVVSPGSRCAPLTIALARHPKINTKTISDERSAAFIALGIAQELEQPVVLVCTSGTAALNYAPAIAEAFYRNIPLIIITADRPTEWIDQLDGQTIRQQQIYSNHIKASYHIPADQEHHDLQWFINRTVNEAVNMANQSGKGPVHINVALREPLYPIVTLSENDWDDLATEIKAYNKILIVIGQQKLDQYQLTLLEKIQENTQIVVVGDIISNTNTLKYSIKHHDVFINKTDQQSLKPDLLITFGLSLISKGLKQFIRQNHPKAHWHIQNTEIISDTFQTLTRHLPIEPSYFLAQFHFLDFAVNAEQIEFWESWQRAELQAKKYLSQVFTSQPFGEFEAISYLLKTIHHNTNVHLANSMTVRYANILSCEKHVEVFANRGTSGIDGSTSTAVGSSFVSDKINILITGDMAFFYDRNALWNKYIKSNFKVVILNNQAGGIFRIIDGPKSQPELEEYFETTQILNAKKLAEDHHFHYFEANTKESYLSQLNVFIDVNDQPAILEVFTDSKTNAEIFEHYKLKKY